MKRAPNRNRIFATFAVAAILLTAAVSPCGAGTWQGDQAQAGYVFARGLELGPNGEPIFAEHNAEGNVVNVVGEAHPSVGLDDAYVMSGREYLFHVTAYDNFLRDHEDGIALGAYLLTRSEYGAFTFYSVPTPENPDGDIADKPALADSTKTVLVRDQDQILHEGTNPILLESRINLKQIDRIVMDNDSVLVDKNGNVRAKSESGNTIGFVTYARRGDNDFAAPIDGAYVTNGYGSGTTNKTGRFGILWKGMPCPGSGYNESLEYIAQVSYRNFRPDSALPVSGALGAAGFDALTFEGRGQSAGDFAVNQAQNAAIGAVLGPVFAKAAPVIGRIAAPVLSKIPGSTYVSRGAAYLGRKMVEKARFYSNEASNAFSKQSFQTLRALLAGKGGRLNPLNYKIEGLGSNLGNVKFRPKSNRSRNPNSWVEFLKATKGQFGSIKEAVDAYRNSIIKIKHIPTSGATITTTPGKTTTIIGNYPADMKNILSELNVPTQGGNINDVVAGFQKGNPGGLNFLNVTDDIYLQGKAGGGFFRKVNAKWVDAAVSRGDDIIVVSAKQHMYNSDGSLNGFGKEVQRIIDVHGYKWSNNGTRLLAP